VSEHNPGDVRAWAKAAGEPVSERGKLPASLIERYEAAHNGTGDSPADDVIVVDLPDMAPAGSGTEGQSPGAPAAEPEPGPRRQETPPQGRKRRLFERPAKPTGTRARKPARVSLDSLVSWAWGLAGMAIQQFPNATPIGRILAIQSPVAGVIVDDLVKDTVVDHLLQPLARSSAKAEKAFALLGPPVLVGVISSRPELYEALKGPLKVSLLSWSQIAAPEMKKAERKAQEMAEQLGAADIDGMLDFVFGDFGEARESPAEEEAIKRARGDG
jgi:hypothetical protein